MQMSFQENLAFNYDNKNDILQVHILDKKKGLSYGEETEYGTRFRDMTTNEVVGYSINWFLRKLNLDTEDD